MKWIADQDEQRIRDTIARVEWLGRQPGTYLPAVQIARKELGAVLENIQRLGQEQAHPEPRIVELSEQERRLIYPERITKTGW